MGLVEALNLATLPKYLSDEAEAWLLLERLRWEGVPVCPHCGTQDEAHYYIASRSGQRTTKAGNPTYRRLWKCRNKPCRKQFSVLVGTVFEDSKVPVSKWLLALYLCGAAKNAIAAKELERHLGVTYATAWFMLHRLREAMTREPLASLMGTTVVVDETFYGGKPKNKHQQGRAAGGRGRNQSLPGRAKYASDKTPIVALIDKTTGEARTRIVADVQGTTLRKVISEHCDMPTTILHTDGAMAYRAIGREMQGHEYVDHEAKEYVRGDVSTNAAESFFAQMKRSIDGTYHAVSRHHLGRYVNEFEFRWNTRKLSDHLRIEAMIAGAVGKRLTYRPAVDG